MALRVVAFPINKLKLGIVGCGAVTSRSHLPALKTMDGVEVLAISDPNIKRAGELAKQYGVPRVHAEYQDLLNVVDAVVLALPHYLHAPIGEEILRSGTHVLMEKPLATAVTECDRLMEAAERGRVTLSVAQVRRYMTGYRAVKEWLATELLGEVISFEVEEGGIYNWPVASDFFFRPEMSGGGVLMDTGAHVLDALFWWLGRLEVASYEDDNAGGVEADCRATLRTSSGVEGTLRLSRIRELGNNFILRGARADLELGLLTNQARLIPHGASKCLSGAFDGGTQTTLDLFRAQIEEWRKVIYGEPAEIASAEEARETIRVISACYARRAPTREVWQRIDYRTLGAERHD